MKTILITLILFFLFGMSYGQQKLSAKPDTVPCLMLVSDSSYKMRVATFHMFGYFVNDVNSHTHIKYLGLDKQNLPLQYVVWISTRRKQQP